MNSSLFSDLTEESNEILVSEMRARIREIDDLCTTLLKERAELSGDIDRIIGPRSTAWAHSLNKD